MIRSQVMGCGSFLPHTILTNADLAKRVHTSDEWIRERTGIRQRHVVAPGEKTSDLALGAARAALANAKMDAGEIDLDHRRAPPRPTKPFPRRPPLCRRGSA